MLRTKAQMSEYFIMDNETWQKKRELKQIISNLSYDSAKNFS